VSAGRVDKYQQTRLVDACNLNLRFSRRSRIVIPICGQEFSISEKLVLDVRLFIVNVQSCDRDNIYGHILNVERTLNVCKHAKTFGA